MFILIAIIILILFIIFLRGGNSMVSKRTNQISGGIFLMGLGILILVPQISFWPWILTVCAFSSLVHYGLLYYFRKNEKYIHEALVSFLWLFGLPLIFHFDIFLAGIFILIGTTMIINVLIKKKRF